MAKTDASLHFEDPIEGPVTAPLSGEALSRSTSNSPATVLTHRPAGDTDDEGGGFKPGMLIGPYLLERKLGEGGMGIVFRATHTKLDKIVAIKILPSAYLNQKSALARFEREMKAVGRLQHANVVQAFDAGEEKGTHYLVMEYVEGTDLQRLVMLRGVFTVPNACKAIYQAALGLGAAHEMGLVHRDVKPSNLFVTKNGQIKILDLGLARLTQDDGEGGALTHSGQVFGTPEYMAPEQWEDVHTCDGRTDLYALGCTLFFLLTGRPPYGGENYKTAPKKMLGHIHDAIPELKAARSDTPPEIDAIYHKLMAKKADERYATATELAEALSAWLDGEAVLTDLPLTTTGRQPQHPHAATIAERTRVQGSVRASSPEVTQALDAKAANSPTLMQPLEDAERTTFVQAEKDESVTPRPRWLWPAVGSVAALALIAGAALLLRPSTPTPNPQPGESKVTTTVTPGVTDPGTSNPTDVEGTGDADPVESDPPIVVGKDDPEIPPADPVEENPGAIAKRVLVVGPLIVPDPVMPPVPHMPDAEPNPPIVIALIPTQPVKPPFVEPGPEDEPLEPLIAAEEKVLTPVKPTLPTGPKEPARLKAPFDLEAAQKAQLAWAEFRKTDRSLTNTLGMEFELIPPGEFLMGPKNQPHPVTLSQAFYVGKYEVLQREYQQVMGTNPSKFAPTGFFKDKVSGQNTGRFPVDSVTWEDAVEFCNRLSEKEGLKPYYSPGGTILGGNGYRLLTEAEWEYACRAGTDTHSAFGQKLTGAQANLKDTAGGGNLKRTEQAGKYPANQFGLCDFHGNVYEWCFDYYDENFVKRQATNPVGPKSGTVRVRRGGSWTTESKFAQSGVRAFLKPGEKPNDAGFRVARTP